MKTLTLFASAALLTSLGMTAYAVAPSFSASASSIHMNYIQNAAGSSSVAPTSSTPSGATSNSNDDSSANDDGSDDGSDDTAGDNDGDN